MNWEKEDDEVICQFEDILPGSLVLSSQKLAIIDGELQFPALGSFWNLTFSLSVWNKSQHHFLVILPLTKVTQPNLA